MHYFYPPLHRQGGYASLYLQQLCIMDDRMNFVSRGGKVQYRGWGFKIDSTLTNWVNNSANNHTISSHLFNWELIPTANFSINANLDLDLLR